MPGPGSIALSKAKQVGGSRVARKQAARAAEAQAIKACYREVDERDGHQCRVCRKRCNPRAISMLDRAHHHHMVYRSRGGQHVPESVITLCAACHDAIHVRMELRVTGDANARDAVTGKLAGVKVERYTVDRGWQVEKWV